MSTPNKQVGVVLMTYGSATTEDGVDDYFKHIHPGKVSQELIEEFKRRYRLIGRSPLVAVTNAQAAALEKRLGEGYVVRAGMRHSAPFIEDAVGACKEAGAESLIGIILSPQFSSAIMEGYKTAFMAAAQTHTFDASKIRIAGPWPTEPHFIELLAERVQGELARLEKKYDKRRIPVIFTTHSLPQRVVEHDPAYLAQIEDTTRTLRTHLDPGIEWYAGYQSAGHTPEAWLKPDLADILAELAAKQAPAVLIVPLQFLADHLEILYDLDIAARGQCDALGIKYHRIELPNIDALFIESLVSMCS